MICKAKARCFGVEFCDRATLGRIVGNILEHYSLKSFIVSILDL